MKNHPDSDTLNTLVRRLDDLETRMAFQDDVIDQLNTVVARQDEALRLMQKKLQETVSETRQLGEQLAPTTTNEPPPHY